ncbi:Casein kinase I isoform gamma-1 [Halotydeus destructor]|nr:Casein kinase I isoform gamma-1 [Halotydeus destructor]
MADEEQPSDNGLAGENTHVGKYKIGRRLGGGSFGEIRLGTNTETGEDVAIKLELRDIPHQQLPLEYMFYKLLGVATGIPKMLYFGPSETYHALVLELLGPSLDDLYTILNNKFSYKTTIQIAIQLIERIEYVHSKKLIYRDIKPENFMLGNQAFPEKRNTIYIIDFGLAKEYIDENGSHIPWREGKPLTGTARYMSINVHKKYEQGRRDDLEAIAYVLFYFLNGKLPWQGLRADSAMERYKKIGELKQSTPISKLVNEHPKEFGDYLRLVKALSFSETPNYERYKNIFKGALQRLGQERDEIYDWHEMDPESKNGEIKSDTEGSE